MKNRIVLAAMAAAGLLAFANASAFGAAANVPAFVRAAVADPHRPKSDMDRDADRLPLAMLAYSGIKPGDTVAELVPAQGYTTRLLSAAVGPKGHVYTINIAALSQGIKDQTKPLLADSNYGNVSYTEQTLGDLKVPEYADQVWTVQNYHDFKNPGQFSADTSAMDKAIFTALKPGGIYVIIDHVAEAGSGARDTGTLHRIDPELVKTEVLAAGFQFVGESKALASPNDPHTQRVPGPGNLNDKSDKFYLKFRKPR
jgi:predicted methyltransferase